MKNRQIIRDNPPPYIVRQYIKQQACWICGRGGWKALSQHLAKKHGLPAEEVRELAYMFKEERLISEELSEYLSKNALIKFGERRHIPIRGMPSSKHILSTKAKDMAREKAKEIRPLAAIAQSKRRRKHFCKICGKPIETSRPQLCSPECCTISWSKAAKKNMTPERIAFFKTVLYKPTAEEQSESAKRNWDKIRRWPIEKQKAYFAKRAEARKSPLVDVSCVICNKEFSIPSYRLNGKRRKTCSKKCFHILKSQQNSQRQIKDSTRLKLSEIAKKRHIGAPLFGR